MYWTLELASYLSDAPWPANKDELIDYAIRTGAPLEVVENLQSIEDEGEIYESIQEAAGTARVAHAKPVLIDCEANKSILAASLGV